MKIMIPILFYLCQDNISLGLLNIFRVEPYLQNLTNIRINHYDEN